MSSGNASWKALRRQIARGAGVQDRARAIAVRTPRGGDLLLSLDGERAAVRAADGTLRFLTTPPGHLFSGHGLVDA